MFRTVWADPIALEVNFKSKEDSQKILVQGSQKGDKTIWIQIQFGRAKSPKYIAKVKENGFFCEIVTTKRILFGKYKILVLGEGEKMLGSQEVIYGKQKEILEDNKELRNHLFDLYQSVMETYTQVERGGQFFYESLNYLKKYFPKEGRFYWRRILRNWRYYQDFLSQLIHQNQVNLRDFERAIFLNPFHEVLDDLKEILHISNEITLSYSSWIRNWRHTLYTDETSKMPERIKRGNQKIRGLNLKIGRSLSTKPIHLSFNLFAQPFRGKVDNHSIEEERLGFSLTFDQAKWKVSLIPVNPNIRVQLFHREAPIIVSIEVFQYPKARNYQDLRIITVMSAQEIWPGFRKLHSKAFQVKKGKFTWEAFDFTFITERSNLKRKQVFLNRVYQFLFPDQKTIYGLRMFAPKKVFETHQKDFEKLIESFQLRKPAIQKEAK